MKILFTGGGTGGHFYPIIAVAEAVHELVQDRKLLEPNLYYMAPQPFDQKLLFLNNIDFKSSPAGKIRRYFSLLNFFDFFKTGWGILKAIFQIFSIYPDVIFSKGGYASFPTVMAAKLFRIPIVIHESDSVPGRVNRWAGTFAAKIAISYPEAAKYFPQDRIAHTGNPVRKVLYTIAPEGAKQFLHLEDSVPVVLILGGSQGSAVINEAIISALPNLVNEFQIIHQTGTKNFEQITSTATIVLEESDYSQRYRAFKYLNDLALRMAAGAADVIISRAGSTIYEIALWNVPSIIIPISNSPGDHQRMNAFSYARSGAAVVIEEENLTPHILAAEIRRILADKALQEKMMKGAQTFSHPNAASLIAEVLVDIALKHES